MLAAADHAGDYFGTLTLGLECVTLLGGKGHSAGMIQLICNLGNGVRYEAYCGRAAVPGYLL